MIVIMTYIVKLAGAKGTAMNRARNEGIELCNSPEKGLLRLLHKFSIEKPDSVEIMCNQDLISCSEATL